MIIDEEKALIEMYHLKKVVESVEDDYLEIELKEAQKLYEEIDILISNIFCLDATDMTIIKKAVDDENKFLA